MLAGPPSGHLFCNVTESSCAWRVLGGVKVFPLEVVEVAHRSHRRRGLVLVLLLGPDRHCKLADYVVRIPAKPKYKVRGVQAEVIFWTTVNCHVEVVCIHLKCANVCKRIFLMD